MLFKLANMFMRGVSFLGADDNSSNTGDNNAVTEAGNLASQIMDTVNKILSPILVIVCAAGLIWAIVLGVNMARADSTEKREEAKKRLISLIVGIVIMVVLIILFNLLPGIIDRFANTNAGGLANPSQQNAIKAILKI